jgi:hypothetical protein
MNTRTKPDLSDLLPKLQSTVSANGDLRPVLAKVRRRYGKAVTEQALKRYFDKGAWHNATIDLLDLDYPDWRGYRPAYLQDHSSAA